MIDLYRLKFVEMLFLVRLFISAYVLHFNCFFLTETLNNLFKYVLSAGSGFCHKTEHFLASQTMSN